MRGASKGVLEGRRNEDEGAGLAWEASFVAALRTVDDRRTDLAAAKAILFSIFNVVELDLS